MYKIFCIICFIFYFIKTRKHWCNIFLFENTIREINENIHIHKGKTPKFPDYIFYKTKKMIKPKFYSLDGCFFDYKTCDIEKLKEWIKNTHGLMC